MTGSTAQPFLASARAAIADEFTPRIRAICTAERPTPPKQPVTKTDCPVVSFAFTSAFQAVTPISVKAAAPSNEMDGGLGPTFFSSAATYSANGWR